AGRAPGGAADRPRPGVGHARRGPVRAGRRRRAGRGRRRRGGEAPRRAGPRAQPPRLPVAGRDGRDRPDPRGVGAPGRGGAPAMTRTWSHPVFETVVHLLGTRTGLAFTPEHRAGVEQGIRRAMERARIDDPAQYVRRIAADAGALDDLIVELTVGETYFFRE